MNSDLSTCKKGDLICTSQNGWERVKSVGELHEFPIECDFTCYTLEGRLYEDDIAPSAFVDPPEWLLKIAGPKPCQFKEGEKLLPCPFCGSSNVDVGCTLLHEKSYQSVDCLEDGCGMQGPIRLTKEAAIHDWNNRYPMEDNINSQKSTLVAFSLIVFVFFFVNLLFLFGRRDAEIASHHLSKAADNQDEQLEATSPTEKKKHYLGLSDNVSYFVEQFGPAKAGVFHYRVIFKPKAIVPNIDFRN